MGGPGKNRFPSCTPGALISQLAPSLPLPPTGMAAPHRSRVATVDGRAVPCPELGQGGGAGQACPCGCCGQGWQQPRYGLWGCSATPGLHQRPAPVLLPPPPLPPPRPTSAGNETSSNYSSQARKSGRSRGPGLTQLRSTVSGHAARSPPFSPYLFAPQKAAKLPTLPAMSGTEGTEETGVPGADRTAGGRAVTGQPGRCVT